MLSSTAANTSNTIDCTTIKYFITMEQGTKYLYIHGKGYTIHHYPINTTSYILNVIRTINCKINFQIPALCMGEFIFIYMVLRFPSLHIYRSFFAPHGWRYHIVMYSQMVILSVFWTEEMKKRYLRGWMAKIFSGFRQYA